MTKFPLLAATAVIAMSGCATILNHSSQEVNFQAVGATDVLCDIDYAGLKYHVRPPQTITLSNSRHDMNLVCVAAGNRVKAMSVPSSLSGYTLANVTNGVVPGASYDAASGAMFKFPEVIVIDFSDTVAAVDPLPSYEALDAVDPRSIGIEHLGSDTLKLPGDDARALRYRMAELQRQREDALEAEREARQQSVEGGWDGDKGGPAPVSGAYTPPPYVPPAGATPPVGNPGDAMPQPLFPSSTSFNP